MVMANQHATASDGSHKLRLSSVPRAEVSPVQPLCVFAARRDSFDVIVRCPYAENALPMIFAHLPMEEHGWRFDETNIERVGTHDGFPIWRINRS